MGKGTKSPLHAHEYVEAFINVTASADLVNLFAYGASNKGVTAGMVKGQAAGRRTGRRQPGRIRTAGAPGAAHPQPR
jgi:hypothetical protein